jgi:hypothetical protein
MPCHLHLIAISKQKFLPCEIFRDFKKFTAEAIVKSLAEIESAGPNGCLGFSQKSNN